MKSNNFNIEHSNDLILILNECAKDKHELIKHHIESMNKMYNQGIEQIISKTFNIIVEYKNERDQTEEDRSIDKIKMRIDMNNIKIESPNEINNTTLKTQKLLPNQAHLYDKTYNGNMYVDVKFNIILYKKDGTETVKTYNLDHYFLSKIPIMVKSEKCNLYNKSKEIQQMLNHDPSDAGGYFIIKGIDWVINCLESITFNVARQFKNTGTSAQHKTELCQGDFISKPGDDFENSSHIVTKLLNKYQIVFQITNNRLRNAQIPFYVLFRAFGVMSDRDIMESIIYKIETDTKDEILDKMKNIVAQALTGKYKFMEESTNIYNQTEILEQLSEYIYKNYIKTKKDMNNRKHNTQMVLSILDKDVLPHIGSTPESRLHKTRFLGMMIHKLLLVHLDVVEETDRDSYGYKRVQTAGTAFSKFFKSQFNSYIVQKIHMKFTKEFKDKTFSDINILKSFQDAVNSHDFNKSLVTSIVTGDKSLTVGGQTKANTISSQQLHRKNQLNVISVLRNITTNAFTNAKQSTRANVMRRVHPSMVGFICTVQSLDGLKVGLLKQLAISAKITLSSDSEYLKGILRNDKDLILLDEKLTNNEIYDRKLGNVYVNGYWIGCCEDIFQFATKYRNLRRKQQIDRETTIYTNIVFNEVYFHVDHGRLIRPLIIVYSNYDELVAKSKNSNKELTNSNKELDLSSFHQYTKLTLDHLEKLKQKKITLKDLLDEEIIEYITPDEQENMFLAANYEEFIKNEFNPLKRFTHLDIPQAQLGMASLTSPMANHNQVARTVFQGNQIKQCCSVPNLNFGYKAYKDQYIHINNEYPLVKTMVTKHFPAMGSNTIMAIGIYEGYNQDDSCIINKSSIDRGLFNTVHFNFIKTDIEKNEEVRKPNKIDTMNIKSYYNYEKIVDGLIPVGSYVEKNDVLIGKISKVNKSDLVKSNLIYSDQSLIYKNVEPAYIWDIIRGKNEDGKDFIKITYYQYRTSDLGNKYCVTEDHEVLTLSGWKPIETLTLKDKIATLSHGTLKYEYPTELNCFDHDGLLYNINNDHCKITCTLNHKIYCRYGNSLKYQLIQAGDLLSTDYNILKHVSNINKSIDVSKINEYIASSKSIFKETDISTDVHLPAFVWNMSKEQSIILLNVILEYQNNSDPNLYVTYSESFANEIQRLAIHAGYNANIKLCENLYPELTIFHVNILKTKEQLEPQIKFQDTNFITKKCKVYCPTVNSGIFMIRKHGVAYWTGNSSRSGQKGTAGMIYNEADMPFTKSGIKPDFIFSPMSLPTRMTMSVILEGIISKYCAFKGIVRDATIFKKLDKRALKQDLESIGFNSNGTERMFNGTTGKFMDVEIYLAPVYYQVLQKFTNDSLYFHGRTPTDILTQQGLEGKSAHGALKIGAMETDVLNASGASELVREKLMDHADKFQLYICSTCKKMAYLNIEFGIYTCNTCKNNAKLVKVPFSWSNKIFYNELEGENIGTLFYTKQSKQIKYE